MADKSSTMAGTGIGEVGRKEKDEQFQPKLAQMPANAYLEQNGAHDRMPNGRMRGINRRCGSMFTMGFETAMGTEQRVTRCKSTGAK